MVKYCTYCGNKLHAGSSFCGKCGKKVFDEKRVVEGEVVKPSVNVKSKTAAGLLGIFLGTFGVHNFYLGYNGKAIAQILITFLSCFVLSFVSALWGLVEGILILTGDIDTDGFGNKLGD